MKAYIIHGNTRTNSNTQAVAMLLADELSARNVNVAQVSLLDKNVQTCIGCDKCHGILDSFGCRINDDMQEIAREILASDLIIFSSPIYTWMPTPTLKAVMDRIYAFTKYPDNAKAFNLLKTQKFAMVTTSGEAIETNCDLFDESMRRMAAFTKLEYVGYLAARDYSDGNIIKPNIITDTKAFADKCVAALQS